MGLHSLDDPTFAVRKIGMPGFIAIANTAELLKEFDGPEYTIVCVARGEAVDGWNTYDANRRAVTAMTRGGRERANMTCGCLAELGATAAGACFTPGRVYRYALWRRWSDAEPVVFVMLNPSIADETIEDRTVSRVRSYATAWGHGGYIVVNAFALVSTDPKALRLSVELDVNPVGAENDAHIQYALSCATRIIVGWGTHVGHRVLRFRVPQLRKLIGVNASALVVTDGGHPGHPLYVPGHVEPSPYKWTCA